MEAYGPIPLAMRGAGRGVSGADAPRLDSWIHPVASFKRILKTLAVPTPSSRLAGVGTGLDDTLDLVFRVPALILDILHLCVLVIGSINGVKESSD